MTKKILIIEDEPATVAGLEETLKEENFEVTSALTGEIGYEKAKSKNYDLIILDLKLPDIREILSLIMKKIKIIGKNPRKPLLKSGPPNVIFFSPIA